MVNMVTGHGKDEETMCAEYKVSSVEVQKISNQFKTEVVAEKNQAVVSSAKQINIVDEDVLLIHPKDAAHRDLNTGDIGRLYSGRGEVALKVEVTDKVKEGIVFTTFHFPEHMVNMVTGHGKDEETMCAEYKVSSVEVQKISNQFKTEVKPKENQAEVS